MDDSIEICAGCGKMPRQVDHASGSFLCSRCGNRSTMHVTADNYEKTAMELDQRFHQGLQKKKLEAAAAEPIVAPPARKAAPRKAAAKKAAPKKARASKKRK